MYGRRDLIYRSLHSLGDPFVGNFATYGDANSLGYYWWSVGVVSPLQLEVDEAHILTTRALFSDFFYDELFANFCSSGFGGLTFSSICIACYYRFPSALCVVIYVGFPKFILPPDMSSSAPIRLAWSNAYYYNSCTGAWVSAPVEWPEAGWLIAAWSRCFYCCCTRVD